MEVILDNSILTSINSYRNDKGLVQNINKMQIKEGIHFAARIGIKLSTLAAKVQKTSYQSAYL